jgi:transposase
LIETDKANGLDPYWYLKHLFQYVPEAMTTEAFFEALLPHNVDKGMLSGLSS